MNSINGIVSAQGNQPLLSFGVISDVQYADIPDGRSFLGVPQYYRHSIFLLQRTVQYWPNQQKLKFVVNFGDIVDGFCPKDQSLTAVKKVLHEFDNFNGPVYHMIGNHCLYNLPRNELLPLLKIPSISGHAYYDFSPIPEYRFVVLDVYDISAIGWPQDHPHSVKAQKFLWEKNPNSDKNSPSGCDKVKSVSSDLLPSALDPGVSSKEALLWNYDEVMEVIHRYSCVKVCLAGHGHKGGHSIDSHGVHHQVLEAALECPPGTNAFGYVDVFDDRLSLIGTDRMESTEMVFTSLQ
ncbi:hypothetical protein RJ639_030318 [Escallonia herrerae]|uniref:Manganese-dependent ADP-ribose/CDP-alcohol diphosphatase n=1 Tax=Escallonia herrerae TaxID=1293975 RepID=A0AA88X8K8_9ASTE|nr:hypothetical protein RJ639_030318 [Escallonia herrerae]